MLKTLVKKHSASEVVRRLEILTEAPPPFRRSRGTCPRSCQNFDKCAKRTRAQSAMQAVLDIANGDS